MKESILLLTLFALLGMPLPLAAQQTPSHADIIYMYRMNQGVTTQQSSRAKIKSLVQTMQRHHPYSYISVFSEVSNPANYVAIITDRNRDEIEGAGWTNNFLGHYTDAYPSARTFVLDSSLLLGQSRLNASQSTFIEIEHVDSDPKKREANLPVFQQLQKLLKQQPGFRDLQVWTWNERTNHWTVIEVWESKEDSQRAAMNPSVIQLWDKLYGNAAAPNSLAQYELIEAAKPTKQ